MRFPKETKKTRNYEKKISDYSSISNEVWLVKTVKCLKVIQMMILLIQGSEKETNRRQDCYCRVA